jgi:DNA-binding response OmpR family regulator
MTKRVLVIDDEDGVREVIQFSLEAIAGWDVITASSGHEGLLKAGNEQPDAILLDVMMPNLDGVATFQQLQRQPSTQCVPVILLTAKAQAREEKQFLQLGIAGIVIKPFKPQDLVQQVRTILGWEPDA